MHETLSSAIGACIVTVLVVVARIRARRLLRITNNVPVRVRASGWFISFLFVGTLASLGAIAVGVWSIFHALASPTLTVTRMLVPGGISIVAAFILAYTVAEIRKAARQDYDVTDSGINLRNSSRHEEWSNIRRVRVPSLTNISVEFESGTNVQFYDHMNGWSYVVRVLHDRAATLQLGDDDLRRLHHLRA